MDIDLDTFLAQERQRLHADKQRLSARSIVADDEYAALRFLQNKENINQNKCNHSGKYMAENSNVQHDEYDEVVAESLQQFERQQSVNEPATKLLSSSSSAKVAATAAVTESSMATAFMMVPQKPPAIVMQRGGEVVYDFYRDFASDVVYENASSAPGASINDDSVSVVRGSDETTLPAFERQATLQGLSKTQKDFANHKELSAVGGANEIELKNNETTRRARKKKDDMEQWVSDTFYSYFPGFNNESQKRQNLLHDRQLEYQQNLLKHQMAHPPPAKLAALKAKNSNQLQSTARSNPVSTLPKTEQQIIVTNPDYASKQQQHSSISPRPVSTRDKLMQDLRHTDISNILTGEGVTERNRHSAELELARKKDYQRELMQQIEDKRRSIEMLREQERRQEEVLTRRIQEQLKTIKLEEELEKEKLRVEKLRFDTEQNRLMREQLLAKLENDSKLLQSTKKQQQQEQATQISAHNSNNGTNASTTASSSSGGGANNDHNKVYKYFSNSARHEYRRGQTLPADVQLELQLPQLLQSTARSSNTERECCHLSEKVCPMCNAPLKSYESCCLRCQRRLALRDVKREPAAVAATNAKHLSSNCAASTAVVGDDDDNNEDKTLAANRSYALVCGKCERLYALCDNCLAKSDVCRSCHRERNVCMNCRRALCAFCLEEIASGRDAEHSHVNEQSEALLKQCPAKAEASDSARSFQVLEVNYAPEKLQKAATLPPKNTNNNNYNNNGTSNNKTNTHNQRPPYSINIERNSIFHPNYEPTTTATTHSNNNNNNTSYEQLPKIMDKNLSFDLDSSSFGADPAQLERVRKETDRRVSRYLRHYGDLATTRSHSESRDRSTQTTPLGAGRRDVVLQEQHNLSMPLLREMPKMTRRETAQLQQQQQSNNAATTQQRRIMDDLKRRWEIPAVQKYSVSPQSPPVLTQVGAIRKQLQAAQLLDSDY